MTDDDPAQEILGATYRALRTHGYADLTLRDIAAESDRCKASIHYHYDDTSDLLGAFLDDLYERYTTAINSIEGSTNRDRLRALLATLLSDDEDRQLCEIHGLTLELAAQAPYDDALRDGLRRFDGFLFSYVRDVVAAGIEAGEFDDVDPASEADFLTTLVEGERIRSAVVDRSDSRIEETVTTYVEARLVADGATTEGRAAGVSS